MANDLLSSLFYFNLLIITMFYFLFYVFIFLGGMFDFFCLYINTTGQKI